VDVALNQNLDAAVANKPPENQRPPSGALLAMSVLVKNPLPSRAFAVFLTLALLFSAPAFAVPETWAVSVRNASSTPDSDVSAFHKLLTDELSARGKNALRVTPECEEWRCLKDAAEAAGASVAVDGELVSLGRKLLVRTEARHLDGTVLGTARMTAMDVEELETLSVRLAEALVTGKRVEETAEVGTAVKAEDDLGRLRGGRNGVAIWALGILPLARSYGDNAGGVGLDLGYWFEIRKFAIEPRIGIHTDGDGSRGRFWEVPFEISAYWLPLTGDVTPFFGVGGGLRAMWDRREASVVVGNTLVSTNSALVEDSAYGFSATARAGVLLFRTYRLRVLLSAEYSVALLELNGHRTPTAFRLGAGLLF